MHAAADLLIGVKPMRIGPCGEVKGKALQQIGAQRP